MRFYFKYPDAEVGFKDDGMTRIGTVHSCWSCSTPTTWIDLEMGEAVCDTECRRRLHLIAGHGNTKFLERQDGDDVPPF